MMIRTTSLTILLCSVCRLTIPVAPAADWPTWRYDARRSAACPTELPEQPHLQWVRELGPPAPAWPNEPRLHFDVSHEPVVAGRTLVVGSSNDGSLTALDTDSGARLWRFHTEGPVRFAPVLDGGKVYAGSDDGYLYCLDLHDGRLIWKVRGAPDDRPDRRHLGNNRLISYWPVRGGPLLVDGTLYFAAGIWPTMGVFVVAVDAHSGELAWRNGDVSRIKDVRLDHNALQDSALSPQGYLLAEGNTLLVPNGRSMPAGLDRRSGKLLYYIQGYRNGDCRVTAMGKYAFVGESGVIDTRTGREVGSRWADAGKDAPNRFDGSKFHLFEGPIFPYKHMPGCSWRSVLVPGMAFGLHAGVFHAYDLARAEISEVEHKHMQWTVKPWRWDLPGVWEFSTENAKKKPGGELLIKAGDRICGAVGRSLVALDLPGSADGRPKVAWTQEIDGTPSSMIAADGKLFVVTAEGHMACFGAEAVEPKKYLIGATEGDRSMFSANDGSKNTSTGRKTDQSPVGRVEPQHADDNGRQMAADILQNTKVTEGYCLVLGLKDGRLVEQLLGQSELKVIGVDADRHKINLLRDRLTAAGLYGARVELFVGDPATFPFPPYLANLVVSETLDTARVARSMSAQRLFDVLRPYGGLACLPVAGDRYEQFEAWVNRSQLEKAQTGRASIYAMLRRVGKLEGSAYWTHECADAARTFFSKDKRVKSPLGVLWYGDGPDYGFWKRKDYGIGVKPQVVAGRLFAFQVGKRELMAYDVYTGRLLWKQPADPFTRYVSREEALYVAGAEGCAVLDPATGDRKALFAYQGLEWKKPCVADIRVSDDLILVALAERKVRVIEKGLWDSTLLVAIDRASGSTLWQRRAKERFNNNAVALGGGRVFCVDSVSPAVVGKTQRRGDDTKTRPSTVLALDARSGKTVWEKVVDCPHRFYDAMGQWGSIRSRDDWLAYSKPCDLLLTGKQGQARAFNARNGAEVWQGPVSSQPCVVRDDTFIPQGGNIFDIRSGQPLGKRLPVTRGGCNYFVAGQHLLMIRDRSVCTIDLEGGSEVGGKENGKHYLFNIRSGCSNSLIAADGLLNVPNFAVGCVCNYPIQTSFAMFTLPEAAAWEDQTPIAEAYRPE